MPNKKKARGKKAKRQLAAATGGGAASTANVSNQQTGPSRGTARGRVGGIQNPFTATTQAEIDAIVTPPVVSSAEHDPASAPHGATCWICLEGPDDDDDDTNAADEKAACTEPEPLRRDCACRGSLQSFAHLSCLTSYATSRSEEIWTGKRKAAENTNWLAFGRPWESCANCKQYFSGQLKIDMAYEYARSTEGMVGGLRTFRHITARSWVTKALMGIGMCDLKTTTKEFSKLLDVIESTREMGIYDANNTIMGFLRANLEQIEAETNTNYGMFLLHTLRVGEHDGTMSRSECKEQYKQCCSLLNAAIESTDGLKFTILNEDEATQSQIRNSMIQMQRNLAEIKNEFSHLEDDVVGDKSSQDEKEMLELSDKALKVNIEERGEGSTDAVRLAIQHAQLLMRAVDPPRPFAPIELLKKTLATSIRSLGPDHVLTKMAGKNLELATISNRKGYYHKDPERICYLVDRYDEEIDLYIMNNESFKGLPGSAAWAPSDLVLQRGALVKCVGLKGAAHLNGKRGWIEDYDGEKKRHVVCFEDEGTNSCLVRPGNLRLLFFEEELALLEKRKTLSLEK